MDVGMRKKSDLHLPKDLEGSELLKIMDIIFSLEVPFQYMHYELIRTDDMAYGLWISTNSLQFCSYVSFSNYCWYLDESGILRNEVSSS